MSTNSFFNFFLILCLLLLSTKNVSANNQTDDLNASITKSDSLIKAMMKSTSMKKHFYDEIQYILKVSKLSSNKQKEADGYYLLGKYFFNYNNNLEKATHFFLLSYSIYDSIKNNVGLMRINLQLGLVQYSIKDYNNALNYFNKITNNREVDNSQKATATYLSALCYSELNDFNKAIIYFNRAIELYKMLNNQTGIKMCEMFKGKMFINKREYKRAALHLKNTIGTPKTKTDSFSFSPAYAFISTAYYHLNNFDESIKNALIAYQFTKDIDGSMIYVKESLTSLHKSYVALGKHELAYIYLNELTSVNDSVLNLDILNGISKIKSQYEYQQKLNQDKLIQVKKDLKIKQEIAFQNQIRNSLGIGLIGILSFSIIIYIQRNRIRREKSKSDDLLFNILPKDVAEELKLKGNTEAKLYENVTVLFTDFSSFTEISTQLSPAELVKLINELFSEFDTIMMKHGIEKIKTIGDSYMAVGGLNLENSNNAIQVINSALEIQNYLQKIKEEKKKNNLPYFEARIGIHTGPVVAGVVGLKKFSYDVWGDTVNTASRMENACEVGKINVSETTYQAAKNQFSYEYRGNVQVKSKGYLNMYYVSVIKD